MLNRKSQVLAAACAALAFAGIANAETTNSPDTFTLNQPVMADSVTRTPLMNMMDKVGAGSMMDEYGITVGGFVEASWSYNFTGNSSHLNPGRTFDLEDQDLTLNQVDLHVDRAVAASADKFDLGGRMEWVYGGDSRFIHSNGLFDYDGFNNGPDEQIDLVQLYLTANIPVGNGLLVTAGKFVTPLGYETIDPTNNPLYSHSYLFGFAIPFTNTGVIGKYAIDKNLTVQAGVVRGWDQATEDSNKSVSFIGQAAWTSDEIDATVTLITGPEQADNGSHYRSVVDLIVVYRESENLKFILNGDYGWEPKSGRDGGDSSWFGVAGYATYKLSDMFTLVGRAEYFEDNDGARGIGTEVTELTLGVNIKPLYNNEYASGLIIRPEVRWDYASDDVFNDGNDHNQYTFGVDAIFAF